MALSKEFPASSTISPSVNFAERDLSFVPTEEGFSRAGLVGFASKGPINIPTVLTNLRNLRTTFGNPHPDSGDPFLVYAAEQVLLIANQCLVVRVADEDPVSDTAAKTAEVEVQAAGTEIVIQSDTAGTYSFSQDSFFRWRLNGILASKTLVVLADENEVTFTDNTTTKAENDPYTCAQLVRHLNEQLSEEDGILFECNSNKIAVKTTFSYGTASTLELVSVQNAIYGGASSITGLGTAMTVASTTGTKDRYPDDSYQTAGNWDFTGLTNLQLLVVVDGTDNVTIDNVVQVIDLEALEGLSNTTAEVVDEINTLIEDLPGGFEAVATGNNITIRTLHHGQDARILVKTESTAADIFGFTGVTAKGTSPSGSSDDVAVYTYGIVSGAAVSSSIKSLTITADSAGIDGNDTQVVIRNDVREGTFQIFVYNNGVNVESWGNLTKDQNSRFYAPTYLQLSQYIRIIDNTDVAAPPLPGTYSLSGGTDGIPSDPDAQDTLVIGNALNFSGLQALSEPEQVDVDLVATPGFTSAAVVAAGISLCENRGDCLFIVDPPFGLTTNEIIQWHNGIHPLNDIKLDSNFAALYYPWVKIRDTINAINVWVPPSGSVMAAITRSDQLSQPWFAPAGLSRGILPGVIDVFDRPSLSVRNDLYGNRNAINPIVQFSDSDGFVIFGQKTLQRKPTALDRINVRRMMFYIYKRVKAATRILLFEPNDNVLRSRFDAIASGILESIRIQRGLTDYVIQSDEEINTPDVVSRNEFRARIGIIPTITAEFFFIEFSLHRIGSDFTESTEISGI